MQNLSLRALSVQRNEPENYSIFYFFTNTDRKYQNGCSYNVNASRQLQEFTWKNIVIANSSSVVEEITEIAFFPKIDERIQNPKQPKIE